MKKERRPIGNKDTARIGDQEKKAWYERIAEKISPEESYSRENIEFDQAMKLRTYNHEETRARVKFFMDSKNKILGEGIELGLEGIINDVPSLERKGQDLMKEINKSELATYFQKQYEQLAERTGGQLSEKDVYGLVKKIASYVQNPKTKALTQKGKDIIIREGLKERAAMENVGFWKYLGHGEIKKAFNFAELGVQKALQRESYFERAIDSFNQIYELMQSGNYDQSLPEIKSAVETVKDLGFADKATNILNKYRLIGDRDYRSIKGKIDKTVKEKVDYSVDYLKNYAKHGKPAAATLSVIGVASLLANNSITGNVVGVTNPDIFGLIGGILLLISSALILITNKKKKVSKKTIKQVRRVKRKTKKSKRKKKY